MEKCLVALDCQTFGVANSLQLQNPDIQVDTRHIWEFRADIVVSEQLMTEYDHTLVSIDVFRTPVVNFSRAKDLLIVPQVSFNAYHPDIVAVYTSSGQQVKTIMDDYNSLIALVAFEAGLSLQDTRGLFRGDFYERCGYLDLWEVEREACLARLAEYGWNLADRFPHWSRGEPFMYSPNHPKIQCLFDLATVILKSRNLPVISGGILPPDNLATGGFCPVYPEIGEAYGVRGSLFFKPPGEFKLINLEQFLQSSFATYASLRDKGETLRSSSPDRYQAIKELL